MNSGGSYSGALEAGMADFEPIVGLLMRIAGDHQGCSVEIAWK